MRDSLLLLPLGLPAVYDQTVYLPSSSVIFRRPATTRTRSLIPQPTNFRMPLCNTVMASGEKCARDAETVRLAADEARG